jgi:hypothetical protein
LAAPILGLDSPKSGRNASDFASPDKSCRRSRRQLLSLAYLGPILGNLLWTAAEGVLE